ncbi:MAG: galactosyldiacylglycerol synthase [Opitutaceae bacterium]|nr:galactosyldiacylglycerol synthase [Opitutaceae bacterium]
MAKVLILTAGYGEGHNSAARVLQAAFNERPGIDAELVDIFALRAPRLNAVSRRAYLKLINTAPGAWSRLYRWLDESPRTPWLFRALGSHRRLLGRIIAEKQPVAIVATFPAYPWLLNQLRREGHFFCPHYTVVTDALTINSVWYRPASAGWFVTDADSAALLRARGVPGDRIHVSGFPVALAFADRAPHLQPPEACHLLDDKLPSSALPRPRVLFMINTGRTAARAITRALLQLPGWHLTITAGRDEKLRHELLELAKGAPAKAEILGWTNRIPELLMTHHAVISKAGGATTQESINAHCPLLISQIVPGQEEGNYELIRHHDAGALTETPEAIVTTLNRMFEHDAKLWHHWRANLRRLARPAAARQIATRVLAGATTPATRPAISLIE